jgi:hypothetical protein
MHETPAPVGHAPDRPARSRADAFRTLSRVHACLVPLTAFTAWYWGSLLAYFIGPDVERMGVAATALAALLVLDLTFKLAAARAIGPAPRRAGLYLCGSIAVAAGQVAAVVAYFGEASFLGLLPFLPGLLLIAEVAVYLRSRREAAAPPQRTRADLVIAAAGTAAAAIAAFAVWSATLAGLPELDSADARTAMRDALAETLAGMDGPPEYTAVPVEPEPCGPEGMLDEVLFREYSLIWVLDSGTEGPEAFYEANKDGLLDRWTGLGYEAEETADGPWGNSAVQAVRPDGVELSFNVSDHPGHSGEAVLTASSGCVEDVG